MSEISREKSDSWIIQESLDRLRVQRDQARAQCDELENLLTEARHMYLRTMCGVGSVITIDQDQPALEGAAWREDLMRPVVKAAVTCAQDPSPEAWAALKAAVREYDGRQS